MSTLQEIKTAIVHLNAHDKAILAAELFAMDVEPDAAELESQEAEAVASAQFDSSALLFIDLDLQFGQFLS